MTYHTFLMRGVKIMNNSKFINRMGEIKLNSIKNYINSRGWNEKETKKSLIEFTNEKEDINYQLLVPTDTSYIDYKNLMYNALALLSKFENKSVYQIFNDIVIPTSDIIRIAIDGEKTVDGTIPFEDGLGALEAFKKAIIASAYSVEKPEQYHKRTYSPEVEKFLSSCRLGQTEKGSFVATFFCPLDNVQLTLFGDEIEKFGRKATTNLMNSLNHIRKSIDNQDLNKVIKPLEGDPIVSGNLCDAILDLRPSSVNYKLRFGVTWANNNPPANVSSKIIFKSSDMSDITFLSKRLEPKTEEHVDTFIGKVSQLRGEPKNSKMQGEAILTLLDSEENYIRAKVSLGYHYYQKAVKYHASNSNVSIKGKLVKESSRIHRIVNFSEFGELKKSE